MAPRPPESCPESDRFKDTPHPRESYQLFGHRKAERAFLLSYVSGRLPQACIISGPPGIGKATLAWRLARFLLANPDPAAVSGAASADLYVPPGHPVARQIATMAHPDLVVLRREWNLETKKLSTQIQVDGVRDAIHMFQRAAGQGGYRICILDCADDLNASSANALLKLVEEPPPRSIFLIVAHRLGRIAATLRSRCRTVALRPLGAVDIGNVLATLGRPRSNADQRQWDAAIARARGSIHVALRLIDGDAMALDRDISLLLESLPAIDWNKIHTLAERVAARNSSKDYESLLAAIDDWLDARVLYGAGAFGEDCVQQLAPYVVVWEKLAEAVQEAETFNLDRRPLVLSLFAGLAAAARASST
jgi:DNA polymerase III subunit delta'